MDGGAGDDVLEGWGDRSELRGDGGDDVLFPGASDIVVHGGTGIDTINLGSLTKDLYDPRKPCPADPRTGWDVDLTTGLARNEDNEGFDFQGIENAVGSDENDHLVGDAGDNYLRGLCGNDRIEGRGGGDEARGDEGDDLCVAEQEKGCEF
jgi:Ca2+-binding RTX toxin-like protein